MSGRSASQLGSWLPPAPLAKLGAFIHDAAFGLCFGSDFFFFLN